MSQETIQSSVAQPEQTQQIEQKAQKVVGEAQANFPAWPTSQPGPRVTPAPQGSKPINPPRREQLLEVGYNQETGTPEKQSSPLPPALRKRRKERL